MARTGIDIAIRPEPGGRCDALAVLDQVLRRGTARADLTKQLSHFHRWPGLASARQLVELADPLAESWLESAARLVIADYGLRTPELQVEILDQYGRFVARVDMLDRESRTVIEIDGLDKYRRRDDLIAEKRRQDRLSELGYRVIRWTADDILASPRTALAHLARALGRR